MLAMMHLRILDAPDEVSRIKDEEESPHNYALKGLALWLCCMGVIITSDLWVTLHFERLL